MEKPKSPDKELRHTFILMQPYLLAPLGRALTFLCPDFGKGKAVLRSRITGDSAPPRRPLRSRGSGSCRAEWQMPWTSAFQVLPPDQVWAFALSLPKYMSLLPTMSALSLNRKDMSHNLHEATGGHMVQHSTHSPKGLRGRLLHVSTK